MVDKSLQEFLDTTLLKTPQNYVQSLLKTVHSKNITVEDWNLFVKQLEVLLRQNAETYTGFEITNTAFQNAVASLLNLPIVGENGNWYIWNGTEYVDSNSPSTGAQGVPGEKGEPGENYYSLTESDRALIVTELYDKLLKYDGGVVVGHYS